MTRTYSHSSPALARWDLWQPSYRVLGIGSLAMILLGTICALVTGWSPTFHHALFGISSLCLLWLSVANTTAAICLFLLLNPFVFLVRNAAPDDIVLSGASSIWTFCLVLGWALSVAVGRRRLPSGPDITALAVFVGYSIVLAAISASLLDYFLGFRSLVVPVAFYFVVRGVVTEKLDAGNPILASVVISATVIALLNWLWYMGQLKLGPMFSQGIIEGGGGRNVLGHHFERMDSLIGGGPSNVGIYLAAGTLICGAFLIGKGVATWKKAIFSVLGAITAYAAFLSLSRSVAVLFLVGLAALLLSATTYGTAKVIAVIVMLALTIGVVFGTSFDDISLVTTVAQNSVAWIRAMPTDLRLLVGGGITAPGGRLLGGAQGEIFVDSGWPGVWRMTGLPGALSLTVFCYLIFSAYYRLSRARNLGSKYYSMGIIAGSAALGLLVASAHTAIIHRPASCAIFYSLVAILFSVDTVLRRSTALSAQRM